MKIVYCLNSIRGLGGIQRVTLVKANALAELLENKVYIVVTDNNPSHELVHPLSDKVKFIHLPINYYQDDYKTDLRSRLRQKMVFMKHYFLLQQKINEIQPDIIVSVGQSEKWFIPLLHTKATKIRELHFNSNYRDYTYTSKWKRNILSWLDFTVNCKGYDKVVLLTHEDKQDHFPNDDRFIVMPNPCSFEIPNQEGTKREKIVLAAGRLNDQKNFASLIRSWGLIADKVSDWKLRIVGEGPDRKKLEKLIHELHCESNVELPGYSNCMDKEMQQASFYVASSKYEGFMLTLVEALHFGLPCVSYAFPYGPKDILTDGGGILVEINNEEALAESILSLINNPEKLEALRKEALARSEDYDVSQIIALWMDLFKLLRQN